MRKILLVSCAFIFVSCSDLSDQADQKDRVSEVPLIGESSSQQIVTLFRKQQTDLEATLSTRQRASLKAYRNWRTALFQGNAEPSEEIKLNMLDAQQQIDNAVSDFAREIAERIRRDQLARLDMLFLPGDLVVKFEARGLPLDQNDESILDEILKLEAASIDVENTAWLKTHLEERDYVWWPISEVGERVSFNIWLLVQHADRDPEFQRKVLRLMEPMVETGEVNGRNFAYLYDRVNEPQRYGTQLMCIEGAFSPRPLADPARVDEFRKSVGLGPLADYIKSPSFDPEHCKSG